MARVVSCILGTALCSYTWHSDTVRISFLTDKFTSLPFACRRIDSWYSFNRSWRDGDMLCRCIWVPQMYLFIGLYSLYGLVYALCNSVALLVIDQHDTPPAFQTMLSLFEWMPLIAVLVAPVVEAIHVPYIGRRKTWIVGTQFAVGAVMLLMLPISMSDDADLPLGRISAVLLALSLSVLHLLAVAHEIATDAWGKNFIHHKYDFIMSLVTCEIKLFQKLFQPSSTSVWNNFAWNYFKIISEAYCSWWIFSNMLNVAERILKKIRRGKWYLW